jgi:hypothetical protein
MTGTWLSRIFPKLWQCLVAAILLGLAGGYGLARNVVDPRDREALRRCLVELEPRPEVEVVFRKLQLEDAVRGNAGEVLTGKLRFSISVGGELKGEYAARVRVPAHAADAAQEPTVEAPLGYTGPFDEEAFRQDAVRYVRRALGTCPMPADRPAPTGAVKTTELAGEWTTTFRAAAVP